MSSTNSDTPSSPAPAPEWATTTPLMKQYWDLRTQAQTQAPGCLLFFRMGDFYELFGEDAVIAAQLLEITLTTRDKNKANPVPMAGVPWHSAQGYVQRLLDAGKKVALAEQFTDPQTPGDGGKTTGKAVAKAIVRREITRLLTPGVQFNQEGSSACYLVGIVPFATPSGSTPKKSAPALWSAAAIDAATGEHLLLSGVSREILVSELQQLKPAHILWTETSPLLDAHTAPLIEELAANGVSATSAESLLCRQFAVTDLSAFYANPSDQRASAIALKYILQSQRVETLAHLRAPTPLRRDDRLRLGPHSAEQLDLPDLFALINKTGSAAGARKLRAWLSAPLKRADSIAERQNEVRALAKVLADHAVDREALQSALKALYDIERILGRLTANLASPKDALALGQTLAAAQRFSETVGAIKALALLAARTSALKNEVHALASLTERLQKVLREDAPFSTKEGGIFNTGFHAELDRLIELGANGQRWLIDYEAREREATGISTLKVRYNRVFGWSIEVTSSNVKNVPAHYLRKQTMAGAERYFTDELKRFEEDYLSADTKRRALEQDLFEELIQTIRRDTQALMRLATELAEWDALTSLAALAADREWIFPTVHPADSERSAKTEETTPSYSLEMIGAQHPVVAESARGEFVANSVRLGKSQGNVLVVTGPNMGGKSTVMRQTALLILLGQMGAPIPARSAQWQAVSSLYTRIGAHDAIARGQSTFMVEMSELAHILHYADSDSFVVLDEIGRGTSTWDGLSVAWATLEHLATRTGARVLFATHYHELTKLSAEVPTIANAHMAVASDSSKKLRFLYELRPGATNESFGIQVAEMAGLPTPVIARAWNVLEDFEAHERARQNGTPSESNDQLSLFSAAAAQRSARAEIEPPPPAAPSLVEDALEEINVNEMTPLQALTFVAKLKELHAQPGA